MITLPPTLRLGLATGEKRSVICRPGRDNPHLGNPDQKDFSRGHEPSMITVPLTPSTCVLGHLVREGFSKAIKSGFPGGAVAENLPATAGDMGSSPGLGRSHMPRSN